MRQKSIRFYYSPPLKPFLPKSIEFSDGSHGCEGRRIQVPLARLDSRLDPCDAGLNLPTAIRAVQFLGE